MAGGGLGHARSVAQIQSPCYTHRRNPTQDVRTRIHLVIAIKIKPGRPERTNHQDILATSRETLHQATGTGHLVPIYVEATQMAPS